MRTRVKDLLASGELGRIVSIESVQKLDYGEPPSSYLLDPLQGGCLYDMGCYGAGGLMICLRALARFRLVKFAGVTYRTAALIGSTRFV